ncbi:MAG TPA: helix-turn-helix domain-containing protein [Chloroflexota bacterium]|nr:helix-turn-helix domain-containing protein [Chloroflexota bacterium]
MSAEERREDILRAAVVEFARGGFHGTSTEAIAARAGVSQPYLFRLFGTKRDLFIATVNSGFDRVEATFTAAAGRPGNPFENMGNAYKDLLQHRDELMLQLHAYAAAGDPEIQAAVRARYAGLYRLVEELSGAGEEQVLAFFALGMFLNVAAALDLPAMAHADAWEHLCLGPLPDTPS